MKSRSFTLTLLMNLRSGGLIGALVFGLIGSKGDAAPNSELKADAKLEEVASTPTPNPVPGSPAVLRGGKPAIVLLSRAVGEVGERVLTSREVRINDAVEQAISNKPTSPDGFRVLGGHEKTFPAEVSKVLDEWVVFLEAKALTVQALSKPEIAASMKAVQDFWAGKPAWLELEVGPDELRDTVERKLVSRSLEKLKGDPNLVPVSDDDALAYYRKNRLRFGSLPFSAFKENIKTFLVKSQTERRLAEWREVLRRKYKVRNFVAG